MTVTRWLMLVLLLPMWLVAPFFGTVPWLSGLAVLVALGLCAWSNRRAGGTWGFGRDALRPALAWTVAFTLPVLALAWLLGSRLGTLHGIGGVGGVGGVGGPGSAGADINGRHLALRFLVLLGWALAQQFMLQTTVLREVRSVCSERSAPFVAAGLFALLHLPNPFLTPVTFVAGLGWCRLYERHPNLVPIALSHACASLAATLAFSPAITGGMRVGYGYFLQHGVWL